MSEQVQGINIQVFLGEYMKDKEDGLVTLINLGGQVEAITKRYDQRGKLTSPQRMTLPSVETLTQSKAALIESHQKTLEMLDILIADIEDVTEDKDAPVDIDTDMHARA